MRGLSKLLVVTAGLLLAGCASSPNAGGIDQNDPYESTNRAIFDLNTKTDEAILLPTAKAYVAVVPEPARDGIHNFLLNLNLPITFVNDLLQGDVNHAGQTLGRFTINTTFGVGGLFDVASKKGIPPHTEDFGITLAKWGVDEGPYIVLPLLGPDNPRDAGGQVVDIFFDPFTYISWRSSIWYSVGRETLYFLDLRSRNIDTLEGIERESIDYYASMRSLYRQTRNNQIHEGQPDVTNLPNL
jgi:phospholipid-binding lipoprotein MlaA